MAENDGQVLSSRRNVAIERPKLYEEMLLKEISATSRTNEPMHAILEAELEEREMVDGIVGQSVRNHALIHYLATLANSNNTNDTFDFDFVESLLKNGADVNSTDKTGQTIFHEVARSWNVDVVTFLLKHGAYVNQKDHFGRSPLHVAAAVDYADMVEFLLQHGADINIRTINEEQTPIHFAAKNDAVNSLQMLLAYGADIDSRDSKNRTPLQVSAQMNRSRAAKHLINEGAPVGVYDDVGNSALTLLIEKIPDVALEALDQFHSSESISRKHYYFLNYLEVTKLKEVKSNARTPLEIAVQNKRFEIILHPVMQRLISVKWRMYGKWGAIFDIFLNLFYTILWSVLGVTLPKTGNELYMPIKDKSWRVVIVILLILLTILEIKKQVMNTVKTRREFTAWREWRANELERDFEYCHPRWPQETEYLQSEVKGVRNLSFIADSDWWIYFDWLALVLILATIVSHVTFYNLSTDVTKEIHEYVIITLLLILWLRIFKYARPFEGAGPFVVIFGSVIGDILKWAFLNLVILIPYTCAFWIVFGKYSLSPVKTYSDISPLLYNVFSMMVVNDHDYEELEKANPTMARLLCGTFIVIAAIITINLLIALLSNTFERHYENAIANAVMQRARTILLLQKSLRHKEKKKYYDFIRLNGSPEVIRNDIGRFTGPDVDDRATIERVREDVEAVKNILGERLGTKFGKKGKKSDMEFVKIDVCKLRVCQEELVTDTRNMKMALHDIKETIEFLKNNWSNNNNNSKNSNDNGTDNNNSNDGNNNVLSSREKTSTTTTSTVVNPTFAKKTTQRKKLGKNTKDLAKEDDTETDNSNTSNASSEFSSKNETKKSRPKKTSKNQDNKENVKKKNKFDHRSNDNDDVDKASNKKQTQSYKEKGDYPRHQQFDYPPEHWQPQYNDSYPTKGVELNMSNDAYSPSFNQTTPFFSPFRRNHDDQNGEDRQSGFLANRDAQPNFSDFNQRFHGKRHENDFSSYDSQRLGLRRFDNTRANQPVFLPIRDDVDHQRNLYHNESEENKQRAPEGRYLKSADGRRNDDYDNWRNQRQTHRFSAGDYGQERYIPELSGFTNYIYGEVPTSQPTNQLRAYHDNTGQENRTYPSRSSSIRLTETRQQNAWSPGSVQTQGPGYQEIDSQTMDNYYTYPKVTKKFYPAFAPVKPPPPRKVVYTTRQDDRGTPPTPTQLPRSPSERGSQVVNSDTPIPSQSPLYGMSDNRQLNVDVNNVKNQRGLVALSKESSRRMPGVAKIRDTSILRIRQDSVPPLQSPAPNQFTENRNSFQEVENARPVVRSGSATPMALINRSSMAEAEEIHSIGVSSEIRHQSALITHGQARHAISSKYPEIPTEDLAIYPEYPTTSHKFAEVGSRFPTQLPPVTKHDEIDDKGTGEEIHETRTSDRNDNKEMLRMGNESRKVTDSEENYEPPRYEDKDNEDDS